MAHLLREASAGKQADVDVEPLPDPHDGADGGLDGRLFRLLSFHPLLQLFGCLVRDLQAVRTAADWQCGPSCASA